ncbi:ATP11-domain-containing protein [Didymella exigua CBS 183.55]|uniref:ATP11-domain-containing protein n=1 Tax=Didymella exigua CBS 183.55 TaxID=1150837 RepID=A0A6A5RMJ5_9PLEO|nr:ATP11-domain-containing protein [Didymella exigua CBS 183.55]KAF1929631.1 ATP11-domain-containing protein [Didymella exigua CBS 183.55]
MSLRVPALRNAFRQPLSNPRFGQRRWAQVQDVRFLATHGTEERILSKYKDKLASRARQEGVKDIAELKEKHKEKIEKLRKAAVVPGATGPLTPPPWPLSTGSASPASSTSSPASSASSPASSSSSPASSSPSPASSTSSPWPSPPPAPKPRDPNAPPPGVKTLDSFLDVSKISALPNKEIEVLWRLRHASSPQSIHFTVPANTFTSLLQTAKQHPAFVLPVPREIPVEAPETEQTSGQTQQAAELHYLQFAHPHKDTTTLLFTSLAEFKLRGEFASPHTTITFHQELANSHNLVLGQGLVIENRGISVDEARWLVMCMQKFYVQSDEGRGRGELLKQFTSGDASFQVQRLIDEAEKAL